MTYPIASTRAPAWPPGATHALLRAFAGAPFTQHGVQKPFGLLADPSRPWTGAPAAFSTPWLAGVLVCFGGAPIVLGLFSRPVAYLLSGEMAVAYFMAHAPRGFWPVRNGGENVVLLCFVFLCLAFAGGGPFGADALRARRGPAPTRP